MKKLLVSAVAALALLGLAACSDSGTDETTTQSTVEQTQPVAPTEDTTQTAPADDAGQADSTQADEVTTPSDLTLQPQDEDGEPGDGMDGTASEPAN